MFGKSEAKRAGQAEADRLCALPVADLATELMPAFKSDGPITKSLRTKDAMDYLFESCPHTSEHVMQVEQPVREGLQMLEHAGLICLVLSTTFGGDFHATRLGEQALAEGDVRKYLTDRAVI